MSITDEEAIELREIGDVFLSSGDRPQAGDRPGRHRRSAGDPDPSRGDCRPPRRGEGRAKSRTRKARSHEIPRVQGRRRGRHRAGSGIGLYGDTAKRLAPRGPAVGTVHRAISATAGSSTSC